MWLIGESHRVNKLEPLVILQSQAGTKLPLAGYL